MAVLSGVGEIRLLTKDRSFATVCEQPIFGYIEAISYDYLLHEANVLN